MRGLKLIVFRPQEPMSLIRSDSICGIRPEFGGLFATKKTSLAEDNKFDPIQS
jgi:hypothetical protein